MLVSLVQGNCTLRPSDSLESVIAITLTQIIKLINLGPKRSKEQAQMKRKKGEREREREKKRKAKKKSHEKL